MLDLPPAVAADWVAAAEQAGGGAGDGPAGLAAPGRPSRRAPGGGLTRRPGRPPVPAGPAGAHRSYLDDPAEQRRYTLRWALTLVILGRWRSG